MATAKVRFTFFHPRGYGWSETWYKLTDQTSLSRFFVTDVQPLAQARAGMLSSQCILESASSSFDPTPKGDSFLKYVNITGFLPPTQNPPPGTEFADTSWTGILFQFYNTTDRYRKAVFTRGQPDDVIAPSGQLGLGAGYAAWEAAAREWAGLITDKGWGWMRNDVGDKKTIVDIGPSIDDPTLISVVTSAPIFPAPGLDPVYARVRINFPKTRTEVNGSWTVQVLSTTGCNIITPMALFPIANQGTMRLYTPIFQVSTEYSIQKACDRRAGRPLLRTPGRKPPRIRG